MNQLHRIPRRHRRAQQCQYTATARRMARVLLLLVVVLLVLVSVAGLAGCCSCPEPRVEYRYLFPPEIPGKPVNPTSSSKIHDALQRWTYDSTSYEERTQRLLDEVDRVLDSLLSPHYAPALPDNPDDLFYSVPLDEWPIIDTEPRTP